MTATAPKQPTPFSRLAVWLLVGIGALACLSLCLASQARNILVDFATTALVLLTLWILINRYRAGGPARRFFLFMALALPLYGSLMVTNLLAHLGFPALRLGPAPRFILLGLLAPALQGIAVLCWPSLKSGHSLHWREFLDALLFTSSLFLVFWLAGLGELVFAAPFSFSEKAVQLTFLVNAALLMGLALYRGLDAAGHFASPLGWILAAFSVRSAGNLLWIYFELRGNYHSGHPMDALLLLIPAFYLLAALAPNPSTQSAETKHPRMGRLLLPYLPFLLALPMLVLHVAGRTDEPDFVALCLGLGMIALLLLRQLIALWDSHDFSRSLEAQVQQRTLALEESQAMLLRTHRMNILATLGAGLAHDLNNLLSVVVMTTDLLEEDAEAGQLPAPKDLNALRGASTQAGELVKKLMAFGRRGATRPQRFDLRERIQGMTKLIEKVATPSVRVLWEVSPEPLYLELDPIQVEQILVNLVANARDAMPAGGILRIRIAPWAGPAGPQAMLSIADCGIGIPEKNLAHLFDAFFTTKDPGKGTGLGLASVKAIADECGATISVESCLGAGTTFTLRFPLASSQPPDAQSPA